MNQKFHYRPDALLQTGNPSDDISTAYFVGLLYAEGHIQTNRNVLFIKMCAENRYILEAFASYLKTNNWVREGITHLKGRAHRFVYLSICNLPVIQNLLTQNMRRGDRIKSMSDIPPPTWCALNEHFWRGVLDGNGTLAKYRRKNHDELVLGLSTGLLGLHEAFARFVTSITGNTLTPRSLHCRGRGWDRRLTSSFDAQAVVRHVYFASDGTPYGPVIPEKLEAAKGMDACHIRRQRNLRQFASHMRELKNSGATLREIAAKFECSLSRASALIAEPPDSPVPNREQRDLRLHVPRMLELKAAGLTLAKIGLEIGCSGSHASYLLKEHARSANSPEHLTIRPTFAPETPNTEFQERRAG